MTNFKNWLESRRVDKEIPMSKVVWNTTVEKIIFTKDRHDNHLLPIFPSMFENIGRIQGFHITGPWNFQNLVRLQHSKRTISAATKINPDFVKYGVSGSGIIAILSGDFLLGGASDLGTIPDQNGHRWISAKNLGWAGPLAYKKVEELQQEILNNYGLRNISFKDVPEKVSEEIKNRIIAEYIDKSKKIWDEIIGSVRSKEEEIKKLEFNGESNEVLLNNINIDFVLVTEDYDHIVEPICKRNGIQYLYLNREQALKWLATFIRQNQAN
jgi:hypothetical protein